MKLKKALYSHILLISLILLISTQKVYSKDQTYCYTKSEYEGTKIFTTIGESQYYELNDFFQGQNLTFTVKNSLDSDKDDKKNSYKILNGIFQEVQEYGSGNYKTILGIDVLPIQQEKAAAHFALLSESISGDYKVSFGKTTAFTPALINESVDLDFGLDDITCFDVIIINERVAVVDCVKFIPSTRQQYYTVFYIVTTDPNEEEEIVEQVMNSDYSNNQPFQRKTLRYKSTSAHFDQTFIISATPFDLFKNDDDIIENYINIYRYVENTSADSDSTLGKLVSSAPITNADLGFPGELKIADFNVVGDWIYILDHNRGFVLFQYTANKVKNLKYHSLGGNIVKRWGMDIHLVGAIYKLYIAETNSIKEYSLLTYTSEPKLINTYNLLNQNTGTVTLQTTPNYVTIAQGMLITIYDQGVTQVSQIKAQIEDAQAYYLWYTDNIDVYNAEKFTNYMIQDPQLKVKTDYSKPESVVTIEAISTNFGTTQKCSLNIKSYIVDDKNNKAPHYTDMDKSIYWNYQDSYLTTIPLSNYWVGPNIQYVLTDVESDYLGDDDYVIIDQPQMINIKHSMENGQSDDWIFSTIIPQDDNRLGLYYSVHQNKQNQLFIFACQESLTDITLVECGLPLKKVELNSRIIAFSYGTWGNEEDIMAMVLSDLPGYVQFHYLLGGNGHSMGELWFEIQIGNNKIGYSNTVLDIELLDNTIYVTSEGKTERFVSIVTFDTSIDFRAYITSEDAKIWTTAAWQPEYVTTNTNHPNTIFIKNFKKVIILDVSEQFPKFLSQITLESNIGQQLFVTPKSLVLAQAADVVVDYALYDLTDITADKKFEYPIYDFEFVFPFTVAYGKQTGHLYILASEPSTNDLYLLVYKTGTEKIRSLIKAILIEKNAKVDSTKTLTLVAGGENIDYIYLYYNDKKVFFRAPEVSTVNLIALSVADKNVYVDNFIIEIQMIGWNGYTVQIEDEVTLVNSQTFIRLYPDVIEQNLPEIVYAENKDNAVFTFDVSDWYNGSVVGMKCTCAPNPEVCGDQIKFTGIVEEQINSPVNDIKYTLDMFSNDDIAYVLKVDEKTEMNYEIVAIDNDLQSYNKLSSNNGNLLCDNIIPALNDKQHLEYIILMCYDYENLMYVAYSLASDGEMYRGPRYLQDLEEGTVYVDQIQYFHSALFVNSIAEETVIIIYDLDTTSQIKIKNKELSLAKPLQQINKYSFQGQAPELFITSFVAIYDRMDELVDEQKYIKLFLTDSRIEEENVNSKIWFVTLDIQNDFLLKKDALDYLDYQTFVQNRQLFVNEQTRLHKMVIFQVNFQVIGEHDYIIYKTIVVTSNTASYEIDLYFEIPNDLDSTLIFRQSKSHIVNVYNNYGSAKPFNNVYVKGDTVAIAYFNDVEQVITVAMYELQKIMPHEQNQIQEDNNDESQEKIKEIQIKTQNEEKNKNKLFREDDSKVPVFPMQGGARYDYDYFAMGKNELPIFPFALIQENGKKMPTLISSDFGEELQLRSYDFNPNTIKIETFGQFEEQNVKITLLSDYSYYFDSFTFKVNPGSVTKESSGMPWWGVFLIVIGSLAVIAGTGFFVWKWKFQGNGENQIYKKLDVESSDAGYSLQAPLKA